jgi:hypothetical protein
VELLTVAQAADRLGVSPVAAYKMLTDGRLTASVAGPPALVSAASVARVAADRRTEALQRVGDEVRYASQVTATLFPVVTDGYRSSNSMAHAPRGKDALRLLHNDASALWGRNVLEAAAHRPEIEKAGSCVTCYAYMTARVHGSREPQPTEALRVLLGAPCSKDLQRWRTEGERVRTVLGQRRAEEMAKRREAEQQRARAEFRRLTQEAQTAAERMRAAAARYATVDPRIARQAGAEARRRHEQSTLSAQERQRLAVVRQRKAQLRWEP